MKMFKVLAMGVLSATLLSGCSGCNIKHLNGRDLQGNATEDNQTARESSIDDISRFKITDVISTNCIKGYPVDDYGTALCDEQTVNLIGLGDQGNLHYSLTILACSSEYEDSFEKTFNAFEKNGWLDVEHDNDLENVSNEDLVEIVKSNDCIWIEYGESSIQNKSASNVDGYIWLKNDEEHNLNNFEHSYNYQMLRGNYATYSQNDDNSKYNDKFSFVNKGEDIVLYGATVDKIFSASRINIILDNESYVINVMVGGFANNGDSVETDISSIIKPGDHIYLELYYDETFPEENEISLIDISAYIWFADNVSNNFNDFINSSYIGVLVKNNLIESSELDKDDKYYDKIVKYFAGY